MELQDSISKVQVEDFAQVLDVWEASVRETHHFVKEEDIQFFRPLVRDVIPTIELYCVRDEAGVVAGFISVSDDNIDMLFVDPDWRGKGIGTRLIRFAVDSLGATSVDVNEQNQQALGFYLHMGFEVIGRSELDGTGKPYPILYMRLADSHSETH